MTEKVDKRVQRKSTRSVPNKENEPKSGKFGRDKPYLLRINAQLKVQLFNTTRDLNFWTRKFEQVREENLLLIEEILHLKENGSSEKKICC